MPTLDMPLKDLEKYTGSTPKPKDFWEFWDRKVKEAYEWPLEYEVTQSEIPSSKETDFKEIRFKGINGGMVYAKYIQPVKDTKTPVILQFHGYPGASRGWFEQAAFAGQGMAVLAMDCPGQGGYSEDFGVRKGTGASDHIIMGLDGEPDDMYYVQTFQDTCLMVRIARELEAIDNDRIYVNGGSQGAGLGLVCTALNHQYIRRCAALYPFLSDYRRAWDMDRDLIVYDGLKYYIRWFDPTGERLDEIFTKLGYIDTQNFVERINCPVMCGTGLMDNVCPPSSQFAVFSKIKAPKVHKVFPEYGHEEIGVFDDSLISFFGEEDDSLCLEQI